MPDIPESATSKALSVALMAPDAGRRRSLATALAGSHFTVAREFNAYPSPADLTEISRLGCDVAIVDLDADVEQSMRAIESICSRNPAITVMAYSSRNDATLMRQSMQAGAREFLIEPLLPEALAEAFTRTSSRRPNHEKAAGKMLVFATSKGGVGVTTVAANFALALAKESGARVVVVDMDFQLGEIAAGLGLTATFSVVDALMNAARLDREFLSTLLIRHASGLSVLGAPEDYSFFHSPVDEGANKLFRILRDEFDYVVVDMGACHGHIQEMLFTIATTVYLVTETTFPALRNAHRLISYLSARNSNRQLEVVVNRFNSRHIRIDENSATKALTRPVNWRVPNAYAAVRAAQDNGVPLVMESSPFTRVIVQMARAACGSAIAAKSETGKGFHLFGLRGLLDPVHT
jgi:pilus assembly protein CpaE